MMAKAEEKPGLPVVTFENHPHPDVNDVCVYGIPAASGAPGESDLVAAIVPTLGCGPDLKGILDLCAKRLDRNSVPSFVQVAEELPKTVAEKNLDRVLREQFKPNAKNVHKLEDYP
jgi:crotonobetaine/carnitine-CoA ligase